MEKSAIGDLGMNFEAASAPMSIAAWLILDLVLGVVAWSIWVERHACLLDQEGTQSLFTLLSRCFYEHLVIQSFRLTRTF
jgi:hypothetical protein